MIDGQTRSAPGKPAAGRPVAARVRDDGGGGPGGSRRCSVGGGPADRGDERAGEDRRRHVRCRIYSPHQPARTRPCSCGPDAFGLRPSLRDIGKRLGRGGIFGSSCRNPFYRVAKAPVIADPSSFSFQNPDRSREAPAAHGIESTHRARRKKTPPRTSRSSTRSRKSTPAKKIGTQGYCMGGPLVVRDRGGGCRIESARVPRSTAAGWSRPILTARISLRRRSRRGCTSAWRRMTIKASRTRRTNCARRSRPAHVPAENRGLRFACTGGAFRTCRRRADHRSTTSRMRRRLGASLWRCTRPRSSERLSGLEGRVEAQRVTVAVAPRRAARLESVKPEIFSPVGALGANRERHAVARPDRRR